MPASTGWLLLSSVFQPICGIFNVLSDGAMRLTSPLIQPRPWRDFIFAAALGHQLHADADAEKRLALAAHGFVERIDHARHRVEPAPAIGEGADARQHDAIRAPHRIGIVADDDLFAAAASRAARSNAFAAECRLPEP